MSNDHKFQIGNQLWKLRRTDGRKKIFETKEAFWDACAEYFQYIDDNPLYKYEQAKSVPKGVKNEAGEVIFPESELVKIPISRPYTIQGLCQYLGCNAHYFNDFESSLKNQLADPEKAKDKTLIDFYETVTRVRDIIYCQKFEGAAVGAFNASIISTDLSLAVKTENRLVDKDGNDVRPDVTQTFILGGKEIRF